MNRLTRAACALIGLMVGGVAAEEHQVTVLEHGFDPPVLTIKVGDTVRWTNQNNVLPHNVRADDNSFRCSTACSSPASSGGGVGAPSSAAWNSAMQFNSEGEVPYYCEVHGAPGGVGMAGSIIVEALEEPFAINFGLTGPWYDPSMSGQGFYVDVVPSFTPPLVAMAWFTFDKEAGGQERQRWFTGIGPYQVDGNEVELAIFRTTGGRFDLTTPPAQTETVGSALLVFESCLSATITYTLELGSQALPDTRSGSIDLQRTTPDVLCQTLANPPEDGEQ